MNSIEALAGELYRRAQCRILLNWHNVSAPALLMVEVNDDVAEKYIETLYESPRVNTHRPDAERLVSPTEIALGLLVPEDTQLSWSIWSAGVPIWMYDGRFYGVNREIAVILRGRSAELVGRLAEVTCRGLQPGVRFPLWFGADDLRIIPGTSLEFSPGSGTFVSLQ